MPNVSLQLNGTEDPFVPLSEASRIARLLGQIPIDIPSFKSCRIEVDGDEMHVYGVNRPLAECRITTPSLVKSVEVKNGIIVFDVACDDFSKIIVHPEEYITAAKTSSPGIARTVKSSYTRSSGESRSGGFARAGG